MALYCHKINRQIFSFLLTNNNKLGFNSLLLNKSLIHQSSSLNDSNTKKTNTNKSKENNSETNKNDTPKKDSKKFNKAKLNNFSFIELNDLSKKSKKSFFSSDKKTSQTGSVFPTSKPTNELKEEKSVEENKSKQSSFSTDQKPSPTSSVFTTIKSTNKLNQEKLDEEKKSKQFSFSSDQKLSPTSLVSPTTKPTNKLKEEKDSKQSQKPIQTSSVYPSTKPMNQLKSEKSFEEQKSTQTLKTLQINQATKKEDFTNKIKKDELKKSEQTLKEDQEKSTKKQENEFKVDFKNDFKEALKIGKYIDKTNPNKEVEVLMEPLKNLKLQKVLQVNKPTIKRDAIQTTKQNEVEFKSLMNTSILKETNEGDSILKPKETPKATRAWASSPYQTFQDLKGGKGLSLFTEIKQADETLTKESPIWTMHYEEEFKQAQETPPINGFDELIQLTNQGKMWKFPIDNEQDIDEIEAQIPFHEHLFLDRYLEEFPNIEPIQQFMTLALNGISQNSFLTLKEKKDIIEWYKSYFNEKLDIIKEAIEAERLEQSYRQSNENNSA